MDIPINNYDIYLGSRRSDAPDVCTDLPAIQRSVAEYMSAIGGGFSVTSLVGGYVHNNGTFVIEDSIRISISGSDDTSIRQLAERLKQQFHQESVLVVKTKAEKRYT